jgi:hypothetical protein
MIKSALAHFADSSRTSPDVREVPIGDLSRCSKLSDLLDHLVGQREQLRRNFEVEGLCGFQVDNQFKPSGLLNREIAGLSPFENAVE